MSKKNIGATQALYSWKAMISPVRRSFPSARPAEAALEEAIPPFIRMLAVM